MKAMKTGSNFFNWTHKRLNGEEFKVTVLLTRVEIRGKKFLQATVRDITKKSRAYVNKKFVKKIKEPLKPLAEGVVKGVIRNAKKIEKPLQLLAEEVVKKVKTKKTRKKRKVKKSKVMPNMLSFINLKKQAEKQLKKRGRNKSK